MIRKVVLDDFGENYQVRVIEGNEEPGTGTLRATISHQPDPVKGKYPILLHEFTSDGTEMKVVDLSDSKRDIAKDKYRAALGYSNILSKDNDLELENRTAKGKSDLETKAGN